MRYTMFRDGGFAVISDKGNAAYAYPTSYNATRAKRDADKIAQAMADAADKWDIMCPGSPIVAEHNARIAAKIEKESLS